MHLLKTFDFADRFVFVVGFRGHDVMNCLEMFGVNKTYAIGWQTKQTGSGDALMSVRQLIGDVPFWVSWGDHVIEGDFEDADRNTVWLCESAEPWRCGVPYLDGDRITHIDEKPEKPHSNLVSAGVYHLHDQEFWDVLAVDGNFEASLDRLAKSGRLWWRRLATWLDLGTEDAYRRSSV